MDTKISNGISDSGDSLQGTSSDSQSWNDMKNIKLVFEYPNPGRRGAVVTFVQIDVEQVSTFLMSKNEPKRMKKK